MLGVIGILVSLGLLMYLAYRGINVLILAPIMALLAVLIGGGFDVLLPTYTQIFMKELGGYLIKFFPLFLLGAIFGKLMDDSGSARSIAHWIVAKVGKERGILAIVLSCGILTYGGVSLFVVAFAVYPIGAALFREVGMPKRFIPGAIALGSFTFTMTAFPGTPAIQNAIPAPFFGTNTFAAPGLGLIGGLIMLIGGVLWLQTRAKRAMAAGEGYGEHLHEGLDTKGDLAHSPSFFIALLPILLVIGFNALFTYVVFPNIDASYLADPKFGATKLSAVAGLWSIIVALVIAIVFIVVVHWRHWRNVVESLNTGTMGSLLPIFNTASEVGYGNVIASLPAFLVVKNAVLGISPNPLISEAVAVNVLAGITGSASGGMSIALSTLGPRYLELANAAGISPELLHRVAVMSSGCFDSLPHNGAVITLLGICRLTHRQSYFDIFMVSVVIPLSALVVVITLGTMFGSF
ncbi:GntP family permease [Candidatus Competibacter phosphatis]|jgi:H+/gluconate symporter-like permease|uniref:GntP family permease n=1 Tax=Candidatus Competibacter phosphatis TaxID=221280 RepID=A0ABX1TPJ5_9GAMM|nr:GntP family permease [Candidatus Competibacter phosphatis]NMQ20596.1 GntP family permease [Candidatus Competibacter phosphatis]